MQFWPLTWTRWMRVVRMAHRNILCSSLCFQRSGKYWTKHPTYGCIWIRNKNLILKCMKQVHLFIPSIISEIFKSCFCHSKNTDFALIYCTFLCQDHLPYSVTEGTSDCTVFEKKILLMVPFVYGNHD